MEKLVACFRVVLVVERPTLSRRMFDRHIRKSKDIFVVQQLEQLDFSHGRYGELQIYISISSLVQVFVVHTPSFSLCIIIFFNATSSLVFRDLARCTSLSPVSSLRIFHQLQIMRTQTFPLQASLVVHNRQCASIHGSSTWVGDDSKQKCAAMCPSPQTKRASHPLYRRL